MAPSSKAKAAGVSASSFLDLKAELAKQESDFLRKKGAQAAGGLRGDKGTVWARANKGVAARNARDIEAARAGRQTAESARAALERKAAIYDKLRRGRTGGLSEAQQDALLVDVSGPCHCSLVHWMVDCGGGVPSVGIALVQFDSKPVSDHFSSDSEDVDESLTVPKPLDEDDPLVEYEDEFGRMRTVRRSEVPRDLVRNAEAEEAVDDDPFVVINPVNHFPVYEPSAERVAAIQEAASEAANPLAAHYDAAREVRAKGAGFYAFSADENARAKEMEALRAAREETTQARREAGAVDIKPGDIEGMVEEEGKEDAGGKGKGKENVLAARSQAMEKRKRELEERRKLVDAKRRKVKGAGDEEQGGAADAKSGTAVTAAATDPFAALESMAQSKPQTDEGKGKSRWDQTQKAKTDSSVNNPADAFLAQLEKDLIGKGGI
ncbi:hypothetical protein EW145_g2119 [Phellinidium pouzarii]|uniref:Uncharacterized protein n=1 Tax=Phellinidium pouzarii TaxID=167371 RepID=A0A4S4LC27_9AGAM|nr:hypothetical protein EW145_g2119 [Phellinidium pouzarii]